VDHAGGQGCLVAGTRVWIQRAEWDYAHGPSPNPLAYRAADLAPLSDGGLNVTFLGGDAEPWPGIRLLSMPGHCPGHMSMLVALPDGWIALAADAADTQKNLTERIAPGILLAGREQALASIDRFKEAAAAVGALMIPGHDPEVWGLLPRSFGASRGPHSVAVP